MTTPTPTDPWDSWDRRLAVGSAADNAGEEPSPTRRSRIGEEPSITRPSQRRYFRKRLPHFDVPGLIQHITFHLADSLPSSAIARMQQELAAIPEAKREVARRQRIQELLDSGLGSCVLGEAASAQIVQDSLLFGDGDRYHLLAWVVMPNHVHVLIEQIPGWPLAKVVQSWKRHTSRQIHRLTLGSPSCTRLDADCKSAIPAEVPSCTRPDADCKSAIPALWQRDYWDRFIRNDRHFQIAKHYIENNPVAAGLATSPEAWPWSSASFATQIHAADNC